MEEPSEHYSYENGKPRESLRMYIYYDKSNRILKNHIPNIFSNKELQVLWVCIEDLEKNYLKEYIYSTKKYFNYIWCAQVYEKKDSKIIDFKKSFGKINLYSLLKELLHSSKIELDECNCYIDLAKMKTIEQTNEFCQLINNRYNSRNYFGLLSKEEMLIEEIDKYKIRIMEVLKHIITLKEQYDECYVMDKLLQCDLLKNKIGIFIAEDTRGRRFFVLISNEKEIYNLMQELQKYSILGKETMTLIKNNEYTFYTPFSGIQTLIDSY